MIINKEIDYTYYTKVNITCSDSLYHGCQPQNTVQYSQEL